MTLQRLSITNDRSLLRLTGAVCLLTLAACSSSDDDDSPPGTDAVETESTEGEQQPSEVMVPPGTMPDDTEQSTTGLLAFVATRSAGFESGRIDRLSFEGGIGVNGSYPATLSDIRVTTDGESIYQIGRFNIDSITRFDPNDTSVVDYQYSVNGTETAANPYSLAFASTDKAYLTRYGSDTAWIVNPAATSEAEFKIGELDLSAYDTDVPNMSDAIIVGERLYILMERLTEFTPDKPGYIAVFDITTDTEIDTGQGADGLPGIALDTVNPTALQYNEDTGEVYVLGRGNFFEDETVSGDSYTGGLEAIDPETFENTLLIDDGTAEANEGGYFVDALVISPTRGYLLTYAAFGVTTLRSFNPTTGLLDEPVVAGLSGQDLTTLAVAPDDKLWVGVNASPSGFRVIDPEDNSLEGELITTELVPLNVVFLSGEADQ